MKNLILGIVDNYSYFTISRFVNSLARTGFSGDTVLFVGPNVKVKTIRRLKENGITVHKFPGLDSLPNGNLAGERFKLPSPINYFNYRHFLYFDYLQRFGSQYKYVLLTDVRDVLFQKDPFDFEINNYLCCAQEGLSVRIKDCDYNAPWIEFIFGKEELEKIGNNLISCAGTTWGNTVRMCEYLEKMLYHIQDLEDANAGIDQAIHNYLIHNKKLGRVRMLRNDEGIVLTLSYEEDYSIIDDKICVEANTVVGTVHQFPRKPELLNLADKLYLDRNLMTRIKRIAESKRIAVRRFPMRIKRTINGILNR